MDKDSFTFTFTNLFVVQSQVLKYYRRFGHFGISKLVRCFETSGSDYRPKQRHLPEEGNHLHRCVKLQIRIVQVCTNRRHHVELETGYLCGDA